jgi:PKD repeat protein
MSMKRPVAAVLALLTAVSLLALHGALATAAPPAQSSVVGSVPAQTPAVDDGSVLSITTVGNTVVAGGTFTRAASRGGAMVTRNSLMAFDANTGQLSSTFVPALNGRVESVTPGPTAGTVYVGGQFTTVNGAPASHVALLNVSTGQQVAGFRAASTNGLVNDLVLAGGRLYAGGNFTTAGGVAHAGFAALNASTGALSPFMDLQVSGHHNDSGSGAQGAVGVRGLDVTGDGSRMVAIGNFKRVDGLLRDQVVVVDLTGTTSEVAPDWNTSRYSPYCFNWAFDTYVRGIDISPDGSYFVISSTGGHNTGTLCDTAARFETFATGTNLQPTWVDYTGGDTLWSVETTGEAVYVGGHQRWMNNPFASDSAGAGAVPRPGIAALDPDTGLPLRWNPGRNPRGAAAFALHATDNGLWVGSDTEWIGNFQYRRPRLAFFPLADGAPVAEPAAPTLPGTAYVGGRTGVTDQRFLYRVNAGGPELGSGDGGPNWAADNDTTSQFRNGGSNSAGWNPVPNVGASVPPTAPRALFDSERWDPGEAPEMDWRFPVPAGTPLQVRLYLSNRCTCTSGVGQRVFDVALDGNTVLNDYDIVADTGDQVGIMKSFDVVSDGAVDIRLGHVTENPLVNGIEIMRTDVAAPPPNTGNSLTAIPISSGGAGAGQAADAGGIAWSNVRGAFMLDETLYYGKNDGYLYKRSFDATTFGTEVRIDPYNDPAWAGVSTGSGGTFDGRISSFYSELPSVTGMFYADGRIYYTLQGQSPLYYRTFSADSDIVGPDRFEAPTGRSWSGTGGLFLANDTVYVASSSTGSLSSVPFNAGVPSGPMTVVDDPAVSGNDWRGRAVFLSSEEPVAPNAAPTAAFDQTCTGPTCAFDAGAAGDTDGTITSYAWDFGDGETGTGANVSHTFAAPGTYQVSLEVTDDDGATDVATANVTVEQADPAGAVDFVGSDAFQGNSTSPRVTVPASVQAGDQMVLFGSFGVLDPGVTGPAGWTSVGTQDSSSMTTRVWTKTATAADAGSNATVGLGATAKTTLSLAAYSGVDTTDPFVAVGSRAYASTNQHTTPQVVSGQPAWLVSFWADKSSATTAWTAPAGVAVREDAYTTLSGRVTSLLADSAAPQAAGTLGGLTATTNQTSSRGAAWSLALRADAVDPAPDPGGDTATFVAASNAQGAGTGTSLAVPAGVQNGDRLVLALSYPNTAGTTTLPAGWSLVDTNTNGVLTTRVYTKVAGAGDGANVGVNWAVDGKYAAVLAGYRGAHPTAPFGNVGTAGSASVSAQASPTVPMDAGSLALTVWADKSSSTTQWTLPGAVGARQASYGVGGGRFSVMLGDSRNAVVAGQYGGHTATTDGVSGRASAWTLELRPAP